MICLVLDRFCKRSNKLSDSIKGGKFLKHLGDRKFFFKERLTLFSFLHHEEGGNTFLPSSDSLYKLHGVTSQITVIFTVTGLIN